MGLFLIYQMMERWWIDNYRSAHSVRLFSLTQAVGYLHIVDYIFVVSGISEHRSTNY